MGARVDQDRQDEGDADSGDRQYSRIRGGPEPFRRNDHVVGKTEQVRESRGTSDRGEIAAQLGLTGFIPEVAAEPPISHGIDRIARENPGARPPGKRRADHDQPGQ